MLSIKDTTHAVQRWLQSNTGLRTKGHVSPIYSVQAAAPAAPWAAPSVPRAVSAKGPLTSAPAVPDGRTVQLRGVNSVDQPQVFHTALPCL